MLYCYLLTTWACCRIFKMFLRFILTVTYPVFSRLNQLMLITQCCTFVGLFFFQVKYKITMKKKKKNNNALIVADIFLYVGFS